MGSPVGGEVGLAVAVWILGLTLIDGVMLEIEDGSADNEGGSLGIKDGTPDDEGDSLRSELGFTDILGFSDG